MVNDAKVNIFWAKKMQRTRT